MQRRDPPQSKARQSHHPQWRLSVQHGGRREVCRIGLPTVVSPLEELGSTRWNMAGGLWVRTNSIGSVTVLHEARRNRAPDCATSASTLGIRGRARALLKTAGHAVRLLVLEMEGCLPGGHSRYSLHLERHGCQMRGPLARRTIGIAALAGRALSLWYEIQRGHLARPR